MTGPAGPRNEVLHRISVHPDPRAGAPPAAGPTRPRTWLRPECPPRDR